MRALFALLVLCLNAAPAIAKPWFTAEEWTLPNGLQVVLLPNHRAPVVHVSVWYKAGGADDLPGVSGVAHYNEHLMFRGTKEFPGGYHSREVKAWGGDDNAFTSLDVTAYFETVPPERLAQILKMEAARMRAISPDPKEAETEHQVIQQERFQTIESDPERLFDESANAQFFPGHVYGRPIIGYPDEIKTLTLRDAQDFHKRWYGPDNATLVLAGDVDRKTAETLVRQAFAPLRKVHPAARPHLVQRPQPLRNDVYLQRCDARIGQAVLGYAVRLPSADEDLSSSLTAQILSTIMDGDVTSPLYKILVQETGVATALSVSYDTHLRAANALDIRVWPAEGKTPQQVLKTLDRALPQAIARITENDVRRAIAQLRLQTETASDEPIGLAMNIGYQLAMGYTVHDLLIEPSLLDAVTLDDIRRLGRTTILNTESGKLRTALLPQGDAACVP